MNLDHLWQTYQDGGYAALAHLSPSEPLALFYLALVAFGHGNVTQAVTYAQQAATGDPDNAVFREAAPYLRRVVQDGPGQVYVRGDAFRAFIESGGNVPLYVATSAALRRVYAQYPTLNLLDIGVGNGRALLPALTPNIRDLALVEPSATLLRKVHRHLAERGIAHTVFEGTLQAFVQHDARGWDIIQATYSLQSLAPAEHPELLRWLRAHGQRLVLMEFDVPDWDAMYAPERVRYVVDRYRHGLAEYIDDQDGVVQGFLMPVLFGYFDQTSTRTNYEQPLDAWVKELRTAGFAAVTTHELYPYWWASAYMIDAQ